MKLRINNNSIRLRLTQTEVEKIAKEEAVHQTLQLGEKEVLRYSLVPEKDVDCIGANIKDNEILVKVPAPMSTKWATTDEVSLRHVQKESTNHESIILIEKDFQCLHKRPDEDERDNFPNPHSMEDYQKC
ncbi:hypothetical protein QWY93_10020 [Echinicola jeungdonensis]|uniref:DUF7009 family protein n=1 Tax=Echinicola jeungdonensis TaxID=709343 RepID=A0ABV5JAC8_9BACT|nr:hypothetical protein [Echinicola jeungdonensis]MDN3669661.1 hypothetical protein [Echinicola jeungdonensis]